MKFTLESGTVDNSALNLSEQMLAILNQQVEEPTRKLINLVAKQKFDINTRLNEENETALMIAARLQDRELVELILNLNANINLLDSSEKSALAKAALCNNVV
ncbi:MAG: ankyrin repeat domain-containing protein [Pseudomonadota bacterium]|nr:ankyrin repeat domain-containing protein [Pseudomonadota bacterium]